MASSDTKATPLGFPDPALSVSYQEALDYAQLRLNMLGHGSLKPFCEQHKLPYPTIINLKNDKLKTEQPRVLQRLLTGLGVLSELIRHPPKSKEQRFLFPNHAALVSFQHQLSTLKSASL